MKLRETRLKRDGDGKHEEGAAGNERSGGSLYPARSLSPSLPLRASRERGSGD